MTLHTLLLTNNACYKAGKSITPIGVMLHSTGANSPNLKRYVGPDDGLLGVNPYDNHWNTDTPGGRKVCPHAFIGKLADGSIASYQTLPWNMRGWHSGSGPNGTANDTHIGIEICEDNLDNSAYFLKVYREAVELTAFLCVKFGLDPMADGVVISHAEGYKRGIASNHGDVNHWFPIHGKTMDTFRADVGTAIKTIGDDEMDTNEFHWGEVFLDDLEAKGLIDSPEIWDSFDEPATRAQMLALVSKAIGYIQTLTLRGEG